MDFPAPIFMKLTNIQ